MDGAGYEVLAVRYGVRTTRRSEVFLHYDTYGEADAAIEMDYYFWVIREADDVTLVDSGFNEFSGARRGRTMLRPPPAALARLGVDAAQVRRIIVTHAHYDHIGNLREFPAAEIVMSAAEYAFWTGPMAKRPLFAPVVEPDDLAALRSAYDDGRVRLVSGRHPYAEGIDLIEVGGHTPGQLIVVVDAATGPVVLASDALHYYEELTLDRPFAHVADLPAMYAGFDLLRELTADGARRLVAGHDAAVRQRFPARDGDPDVIRVG